MEDFNMTEGQPSQYLISNNHYNPFREETIEKKTGALIDPDIVIGMTMPYGGDPGGAPYYLAIPKELAAVQANRHLQTWAWRVEFHSLAMGSSPLGLDLLGPVILGRASPRDPMIDVDFTTYDAMNRGVSRRHALIRPSDERLYLIDLSSTNGTRRNEVQLGAGIAVTIEDRDTISLGELTFEVRIIRKPDPAMAGKRRAEAGLNDTQPMHRDEPPDTPQE